MACRKERSRSPRRALRLRPASRTAASSSALASGPNPCNATKKILPDENLLLGPKEGDTFGLRWDKRWLSKPSGPKNEAVRNRVRAGTKEKVAKELKLMRFGKPFDNYPKFPDHFKDVILFAAADRRTGVTAAGGSYLLGRNDIVCVKAKADYDKDWQFIKTKRNRFWIMHAAALNIGESKSTATGFKTFSVNGSLDEMKYLDAMQHLMCSIVKASQRLQVRHVILFPFGMGAFLRNLSQLDPRYADATRMQELRRKVAIRFAAALQSDSSASKPIIHMCLRFSSLEEQQNGDGFIRALAAAPLDLRNRLQIWADGDSLQIAHDLSARQAATSAITDVLLVNGANRSLLGNHWFTGGAKRAIDENLHRRSWTLSASAYLLNKYLDGRDRKPFRPEDLPSQIKKLGGRVETLT